MLGLSEWSTSLDASDGRGTSAEAAPPAIVMSGSDDLHPENIPQDDYHLNPASSTAPVRDADGDIVSPRRRRLRHVHDAHLHEHSDGEAENNTIEGDSDCSEPETVIDEHESLAPPDAEVLGESLPRESRESVVDQERAVQVDGAGLHTDAGTPLISNVPQRARASRKRARPLEDEDEHRASTGTADRNLSGQPPEIKEITFEEVYRWTLEEPDFKTAIVQWPKDSRRFYIVPCMYCGMTWGDNPMQSARSHLVGPPHKLPKGVTNDTILQHLGIAVTRCNLKLMHKNNKAHKKMLTSEQYIPKKHVQLGQRRPYFVPSTIAGRQANAHPQQSVEPRPESPGIEGPRPRQDPLSESLPGQSVLDPVRGTVYKAWRPGPEDAGNSSVGPGWCFATPLPIGDLAPIGMTGNLLDTPLSDAHGSLPECYDLIDQDSGTPIRWSTPFEDGGPRAARREIPMLLLVPGVDVPPAGQEFCMTTEAGCRPVVWVEVRHLREEHFQPPQDQPQDWVAADGRAVADAFKARLDGLQLHRPSEPMVEPEEPVAQPEAPMVSSFLPSMIFCKSKY